MTDFAAYALVIAVAILAIMMFFDQRKGDRKTDAILAKMDEHSVQFADAFRAMQDCVRATDRVADAVVNLVDAIRRQWPPEAPAEWLP